MIKKEVRKILLIGNTGNGKSTLANVLTQTNAFAESSGRTSQTKEPKLVQFNHEDIAYEVIDTVGLNDTGQDQFEVLEKLANVWEYIGNGITQVLFVTRGRFTKEEFAAFELLSSTIFDENIYKYTTIIVTSFPEFEIEEECQLDINKNKEENQYFAQLIEKCGKVIHIDNPSLVGSRVADANRQIREISREKIIAHLVNKQEIYKPISQGEFIKKFAQMGRENNKFKEKAEQWQARFDELKARRWYQRLYQECVIS